MTSELLTTTRGRAGIITLNRPKSLNALNQDMASAMLTALEDWRDDDSVDVVIVRGEGDRAFCSGGDIAALYHDAKRGGYEGAEFWATEYRLNLTIANYPKPYVPLMKGIVLGGGVGLSSHGSHRVVTDTTRFGMPETGIGFFPDIGATKLLADAPGNLGLHLALTSVHVGAAEAIHCGLADVMVKDEDLEQLVTELSESGDASVIEKFVQEPGEAFDGHAEAISQAYDEDSVEAILANLDALDAEWAEDAAQRIRRNCPLTLEVALRAITTAGDLSLTEAVIREFGMVMHAQRNPNFAEGVRAQIIDKDRTPSWQPATLAEVTEEDVQHYFEPLEDDTLLDWQRSITQPRS